jgi:magnesium-transporting ATPase (P-type)
MVLTDDNFCSIVDAIEQGRIIYAGIQKFVSFIMSVHFAEVMQIFLCIVSSIPVMRQPLQILFLILVTDLPPSIALGFEPGEALTMKRAPRPKTQPIVLMSMWIGIVAHGMILTACIFSTYMVALWVYAGAFVSDDITDTSRQTCSIWDNDGSWGPTLDLTCGAMVNGTWTAHANAPCDICVEESIRRARTCAFISLVWAEGLRAYVSRSFENPFWVETFSNTSMNCAVGLAQVTLAIALFLPGLSDTVLGLYVYEIHWFGWFFAALGALACLVFCEIFKFFAKQFVEEGKLANYEEGKKGANGTNGANINVKLVEVKVEGTNTNNINVHTDSNVPDCGSRACC